ncbi:MAG TPA: transcriptional repressor LexA [Terrimesophilobacter sp.]|nr:transcriptional repressor LexA [Terrimesophilobacter sp.]
MDRSLTAAQAKVLAAIRRRLDENEPAPTYRDLCAEFGWASTGTARDHLRALACKGHVELPGGRRHRQIRLKDAPGRGVSIPLVGRVVAGKPVAAEQSLEGRIAVPGEWVGRGSHFALLVYGESMLGAGILDGDHVIVRQEAAAEDGDIVAATVEGETTLKRLRRRGSRCALVAENPHYPAIDVGTDGVTIHGVVVGLLRKYGPRRSRLGMSKRGRRTLRRGT